ncbi:hypothetical protein [Actinoplanes derwentensis]|uniref:Uncharacterized protein n=2 Tax=Actinoplanes derwentensis TaxID=113562 RepID=A0A1H1V4S3_9ACTN|nr:hypothetical protein [Actinoplanes derwentensis]SDS79491.1 hypothetical protein SAMN04489716_1634 [Actinoplanes derwentensis]
MNLVSERDWNVFSTSFWTEALKTFTGDGTVGPLGQAITKYIDEPLAKFFTVSLPGYWTSLKVSGVEAINYLITKFNGFLSYLDEIGKTVPFFGDSFKSSSKIPPLSTELATRDVTSDRKINQGVVINVNGAYMTKQDVGAAVQDALNSFNKYRGR